MSDRQANIAIPVDLTNPGQFFACCGLLELADRLWPGAVGWFDRQEFRIQTIDRTRTLSELLSEARSTTFNVGDDSESDDDDSKDDDLPVEPIRLQWKNEKPAIHLDWWTEKSIKPWAGSMKERVILRAMLNDIDPENVDPFNDLKAVLYKSPKKKKPDKKEPFYFDPRRGNKSHPLDSGFSPDTHKMQAECCPALESLCFIGLQRARPAATGTANQSRYTVWTQHIAANLVGAVVCGIVPIPGSINYVFNNYFRTDQRKHKTFSQATLERNKHV
ncbi:MAG: type I-U CRISPR-associated protein Cas8c [Planctomycetaceae bacterium]